MITWLSLAGVFLIIFLIFLSSFFWDFSKNKETVFGVTFSKKYAEELKLNWQEAYLAILQDLKVDHVRLVAYWDEIEKEPDQYIFNDLDWQVRQASDRGVKIIMVLGRRTPRWPECHDPNWLKGLDQSEVISRQMNFINKTVERYQNNSMLEAWQVENEPLLTLFGQCPAPSLPLLKQEVALVKSLDVKHPIIVTDSGELSTWQTAASVPDILGTTLYRIVWNKYMGFLDYFFVPSAYYHVKADLTKFFHKNLKDIIVVEMQMEPWTYNRSMIELTQAEQEKSFNLERFRNNVIYAQKTGFSKIYFWGVEYWYWLKQNNRPEIWNQAKSLWP